jgi:DNA repair protein RecO (recombination protein O)
VPVRLPLYRDDAVVLRVQKLGESDRIITMLTRRHGRVRAAAKGIRRTQSRFGARLEPFGYVDIQLAGDPGNAHRSLHTVRQVEGIELHGKDLARDYPRYTAASAVAETAERLTPIEYEPALRLFQLTLGALRSLAGAQHATTGAFSVAAGGAVCPECRPPGATHPAPPTVGLMTALLDGDWRTADASDHQHRRECSGLVAAHLQWHLERGLRSLPLVDRTNPERP